MFRVCIHRNWLLCIAFGGAIATSVNCAQAQITPDQTLTNNSRVTSFGNINLIEGGTQSGRNLFHSFQEFSVPKGGTAHFNNNASEIQNIISRVTGKSISHIDGVIQTEGTANLFFINPNGIIFGSNASLKIGGSFVASTANAIQFGNQGFFSATNPDTPALLTIHPSALLFNQITTAPIRNNSYASADLDPSGQFIAKGLRVPDGQSLFLVGGNVTINGGRSKDSGGLNAFGGRVELGGLAGAGIIGLNGDGNNLSLRFPDGVERSDVSLVNHANINVSASFNGSININARNIDIIEGSSLLSSIATKIPGTSSGKVGDITLNAIGAIRIQNPDSRIENNVQNNAIGNAGNISITAESLKVTDGAVLNTSTSARSDAGKIIINTSKDVLFDKSNILTSVQASGRGNGGDISITTGTLSLANSANLDASTKGQGNAGKIILKARGVWFDNSYASTNVEEGSKGQGGNIYIETGMLSLTNGGQLRSDTSGEGNAGLVMINADTINLDGKTSTNASGIFSRVLDKAIGDGGKIYITTGVLSVRNGAGLFANISGQGEAVGNVIIKAHDAVFLDAGLGNNEDTDILTSTTRNSRGNSANVSISTGSLFLTNNAKLVTSNSGQGNAGDVIITARDRVSLDNHSQIISDVDPTNMDGKAGQIHITTQQFSLANHSIVNTSTAAQNQASSAGEIMVNTNTLRISGGVEIDARTVSNPATGNTAGLGNINIHARDYLLLLQNSKITTTSADTRVTGGRITINTNNLVAIPEEKSDITSGAKDSFGGGVIINATDVLGFKFQQQNTPLSNITAASDLGPQFNGTVQINSPDVDPSRGLVQQPPAIVEASPRLISQSCNAFNGKDGSSFTVTGRGGLPPSPDEPLTSDVVWTDTRLPATTVQQYTTAKPPSQSETVEIVPATGWVFNGKGEVTLISSTPSATRLEFTPTACPYGVLKE